MIGINDKMAKRIVKCIKALKKETDEAGKTKIVADLNMIIKL